MVEAAEYGTNRLCTATTYLDSIEFFQKCHWKNTANYSDLYLKKGLSAPQIGEKLNLPKQTVLGQLQRDGIRLGTNRRRMANPENYRLLYAPYGFSKKDGKLIPNKAELKICRLVVGRGRKGTKISNLKVPWATLKNIAIGTTSKL